MEPPRPRSTAVFGEEAQPVAAPVFGDVTAVVTFEEGADRGGVGLFQAQAELEVFDACGASSWPRRNLQRPVRASGVAVAETVAGGERRHRDSPGRRGAATRESEQENAVLHARFEP